MTANADLSLIIRKTIAANPEQVFRAWTHPEALQKWWGPVGVTCHEAEVDLRIGGAYRIGNTLPDGNVIWITGEFEKIETNSMLVYTWSTYAGGPSQSGTEEASRAAVQERVTVKFNSVPLQSVQQGTEVIVIHEKIETQVLVEQHLHGWEGCLAGLLEYKFLDL